jgi:hypothetical protein
VSLRFLYVRTALAFASSRLQFVLATLRKRVLVSVELYVWGLVCLSQQGAADFSRQAEVAVERLQQLAQDSLGPAEQPTARAKRRSSRGMR